MTQEVYQFAMTISKPPECTLASLSVFKDDIPEVTKYNTEKLYIKFTSWPKKCLFTELPYLKLLRMENTLQHSIHPQVHERLQKDLAAISSLVKKRGGDYNYLDPENVGCSIHI